MSTPAPKKSRTRQIIYTFILCGTIVAFGTLIAMAASSFRVSTAVGDDEAPAAPPNVNVMPLETQTVRDILRLTGGIEPWHDVTLSAEVGGRVIEQPVEEGDRVRAGDVLVRIDTDLLRARMDEIEAQLELAREDAGRLTRLRERGAGTPQDADRAATQVRVLEANLRTARINLERSVVRSPVDGVVDMLHQEESEFVDAGLPLARIVQVERVKVAVGLPERDVPFFEPGGRAGITLDALPGRDFEGVIHRIATTASPGTRTFHTQIEIDNEDGAIRPGMIARVSLLRREFPDSFLIPMNAVIPLDERHVVFLEENGLAHLREITVGLMQGAEVQVVDGLSPGERLIVTGQRDVRPGEAVAVREVLGPGELHLPQAPGELPL